jgi:hypothetical protein
VRAGEGEHEQAGQVEPDDGLETLARRDALDA